MAESFVGALDQRFSYDVGEKPRRNLWKSYEHVIIESLITSFGLDTLLLHDQHGGDVDTVHNVRQIGLDPEMGYKSAENQRRWDGRAPYKSSDYHQNNPSYRSERIDNEIIRDMDLLTDPYTGKPIPPGSSFDLDHGVSAKELYDDRGTNLSGLDPKELANRPYNLHPTDPSFNRSKSDKSMDDASQAGKVKGSEQARRKAKEYAASSREKMDAEINRAYYTSARFRRDTLLAAGDVSLRMGMRQALGLVLSQLVFAVKDRIQALPDGAEWSDWVHSVGDGIRDGWEYVKKNFSKLLSRFKSGAIAGFMSSLTTTLCNIFFKTAKSAIKVIRQTWASLVDAAKILFMNPDRLPMGEQIKAAAKVIATGASVVVGGLVSSALAPVTAEIPLVGDIVQTFCGTLVTGLMSCSLLYYLDTSKKVKKMVEWLNRLDFANASIAYFREQTALFEEYAARLGEIDIARFKRETESYRQISLQLTAAASDAEVNTILLRAVKQLGIPLPWKGDFDEFMSDKNNHLVF